MKIEMTKKEFDWLWGVINADHDDRVSYKKEGFHMQVATQDCSILEIEGKWVEDE